MHVDLNLLRSLDALLDEQSVQRAADRLHLSQPAMSRTLSRIRAVTGDEILIRSGRSMVPTSRALDMREEIRVLVQRADAALGAPKTVPLALVERIFTVRGHDVLIAGVAPWLVAAAQEEAPGVTLRFQAETSTDSDDLRRGRVDLELGSSASRSSDIRHVTLGITNLMVALREGHPLQDSMTLNTYARSEHIIVSRRGRLQDPVDEALENHGLKRRVVATVPALLPALYITQQGDALTTLPAAGLAQLVDALRLALVPLPVAVAPLHAFMSWHARHEHDAVHQWLREKSALAFAE